MMHWLDDVGRPYCAATMMTVAVDSSAQKPRVGDSLARRAPMALGAGRGGGAEGEEEAWQRCAVWVTAPECCRLGLTAKAREVGS